MAVSIPYIEPGTIGDYVSLRDLVAAYMDRDDLEAMIPNFIAIIEAELNRRLRTVNQEFKDIWVISDEAYSLPSDFRKLRKIHIEGNPDRPLAEMSPTAVPNLYSGEAGIPQGYWLEGRVLSLAPPPNEATTFRVTYFQRIPPLTLSEPYNWVIREQPDLYVWGALREAAAYIRDPDGLNYASGRFESAVEQTNLESRRDRWGGGPLVPSALKQVRVKC
ncbi:phage adaptor protein [Sphingobium olei]|uniref:Uncharacterized protein n=1 Tax=Sphingobium olei TaxID=420955 RepID=A0ABW3P0J6_9SPHN